MTELDPWDTIESPHKGAGINARRADASHRWNFFWGRDLESRCLLVLRIERETVFSGTMPKLRGVDVCQTKAPGSALVLTLLDTSQRQIFYRLCTDIVESTVSAETELEAVQVAVRRTWRWHYLLRGAASELLSEEAQKGLIGELLILERHLLPQLQTASAVEAWRGPLDSPKDFELGNICIEAKARRGAATPYVLISSEHQLDTTAVEQLFLHIVDLARAPSGSDEGFTLTDVATRVERQICDADGVAGEEFAARLLAAGFRFEDDYSAFVWLEGRNRIFDVADTFPRIAAGDLPTAVENVRYSLSLNDLDDHEISASQFELAINGGAYAG